MEATMTRLEQIRKAVESYYAGHDYKTSNGEYDDLAWLLERLDEMREAAKLGATWADRGASHARRSRFPGGERVAKEHAEKIRAALAKLEE
jgi:hypothetical protein